MVIFFLTLYPIFKALTVFQLFISEDGNKKDFESDRDQVSG